MKEVSDVIACVVDWGLVGAPMAERLAQSMKHVYLFSEWHESYATVNKWIVGHGFENVSRVEDIFKLKRKRDVDLWVFPDVQWGGLELELEDQGYAVWGSRDGELLELNRELFLETLAVAGLDVPAFEVKEGLNDLREFLRDKEDYYIKISKFRGSIETTHWRNWTLDEGLLDLWAVRLGPAKELIRFICFPAIDTPLEIGGDNYCVDGQWPSLMLHGIEWKDRSYFASVTKREEMPEQLQRVMEAFSPVLAKYRYRNQWSMEVRVKGDAAYFIDPTCRMGLPSTGSQLELWRNWPEIVWAGANGQLVDPEPAGKFSAESILTFKGDPAEWRVTDIPKELRQWVKLADCCEIDGRACFPSGESPDAGDDIGWLVAIGDTPEETIKNMNEQADLLPDGLDANTECLAYVLKEIGQEEKGGIEFSKQQIPEPAIVMED